MDELQACTYAAELLKRSGFECRWVSLKSEACYYAMPGRVDVLRVAAHRFGGAEWGLATVVSCLTLTPTGGSGEWNETRVEAAVAAALGWYMLRSSGAVRMSAKERARQHPTYGKRARGLRDAELVAREGLEPPNVAV